MVKQKPSIPGLDYTECTTDELRGFVETRTGKSCALRKFDSLVNKLKRLDKNARFRFLDLPAEMRLAIYAELLHRPDPYDTKKLHPQILATSKEIHREAEPELNQNTTMLITIKPDRPIRMGKTIFKMGSQAVVLKKADRKVEFGSLWALHDNLTTIVRGVRHITIDLDLQQRILKTRAMAGFRNQVNTVDEALVSQYLFTLTAALRGGSLRMLSLKLDGRHIGRVSSQFIKECLWPLSRIETSVEFEMEGAADDIADHILSKRAFEDGLTDSIALGRKLVPRVKETAALLAHLNDPAALLKIEKLCVKTMKATRWYDYHKHDLFGMRRLEQAEAALQTRSMKKLIQKATAVKAAKDEEVGFAADAEHAYGDSKTAKSTKKRIQQSKRTDSVNKVVRKDGLRLMPRRF